MILELLKIYVKRALGRGSFRSYGQNGEDAIVQSLLRGVKDGVYIDVGSYHPVLYSNTYAFYTMGWRGVVIDPNARMRPLFRIVRPRDTFVHAGIGESSTTKTYYAYNDGAYNTFDPQEARERANIRRLRLVSERPVDILPLSEIIARNAIEHIDFLDVDAEGMDLSVLRSHDWAVPPRVIAVENENFDPDHPERTEVYAFLRAKGYRLAGMSAYTLIFKHAAEI